MDTILILPKPSEHLPDTADQARLWFGIAPGTWAVVVDGDVAYLLLEHDVWCWRVDPT